MQSIRGSKANAHLRATRNVLDIRRLPYGVVRLTTIGSLILSGAARHGSLVKIVSAIEHLERTTAFCAASRVATVGECPPGMYR